MTNFSRGAALVLVSSALASGVLPGSLTATAAAAVRRELPATPTASAPASAPSALTSDGAPRLLSAAEASRALIAGPEAAYYARMQLGEMRAKTGQPLQGMTLEAARELVRADYAASTLEFAPDEQRALTDTVRAISAALRAKAPLYALTPWSFIKVDAHIEGGLPHTRGDCIVLSGAFFSEAARRHGAGWTDSSKPLWVLLIHEQTHVLQRRHPALFADLYTRVFGFRHVDAPPPPWLIERSVINPDGPDVEWAFPVGDGATRAWILPELALTRLNAPHMPQDFEVLAVGIREEGHGRWTFAERDAPGAVRSLSDVPEYRRAFPDHSEDFHPNEISAGMLSEILADWPLPNADHALWDKTRAWMDRSLR